MCYILWIIISVIIHHAWNQFKQLNQPTSEVWSVYDMTQCQEHFFLCMRPVMSNTRPVEVTSVASENFWTCVLYAHTSEWRTISLASSCISRAKLNLINICYVLMGYMHVEWEHSMLEILQIEKSME